MGGGGGGGGEGGTHEVVDAPGREKDIIKVRER